MDTRRRKRKREREREGREREKERDVLFWLMDVVFWLKVATGVRPGRGHSGHESPKCPGGSLGRK